ASRQPRRPLSRVIGWPSWRSLGRPEHAGRALGLRCGVCSQGAPCLEGTRLSNQRQLLAFGIAPARIPEALSMMERFYTTVELPFDRERARRALDGLPPFGGWWFLEQNGSVLGYFVLTTGYSLEFGGVYALLDEFFIEPPWRGKGIGTAAMSLIL